MRTDRYGHAATLLVNGQVLIVGGWNGHVPDAADDPPWDPTYAELFDPHSNTFRIAADMGTTRSGGPVATRLTDGNVLVFGGIWDLQNLHVQPVNPPYAQIYDVRANAFRPFDVPLHQLGQASATLLPDGRVLMIDSDSSGISRSAAVLDPTTKKLVWGGDLLSPRLGQSVVALRDGRVLVIGGTDANGNALASVEVWTPEQP
jgi:hypothetical protein